MAVSDSSGVILVHDWLTGMRGGEKCLESLCRRYPDANLYTLLHDRGKLSGDIERMRIHTSFLQRLPQVERYYRYLLPAMPFAPRWNLRGAKLVISSSHCVAKAVQPPPGVPHICYCYTPMRYAWHLRDAYFGEGKLSRLKSKAIDQLLIYIRDWDRRVSDRVTHFIAISRTVQQRILQAYGRASTVIYPPADTNFYTPDRQYRKQGYYLVVSAFAPYKRIEQAIVACNQLKRQLVIVGQGQDRKRLESLAGPTVQFLGWQSNAEIRNHYRQAEALLFPGEEDFGITPVEAMACGLPVIAWGKGGITETTLPLGAAKHPSAIWYDEPTVEALQGAIATFEANRDQFDARELRRQALRFDTKRFEMELFNFIDKVTASELTPQRRAA